MAAVVVTDDQGRYVKANRAARDILGYSLDELQTMDFSDLQSSGTKSPSDVFMEFIEEGTREGEFSFVSKQGEAKTVQYLALRAKENFNIIVFTDVSEQAWIFAELERSQQELTAAQLLAGTGSWSFDFESGKTHWSEGMFGIMGLDPLQGVPPYEEYAKLFHPDDFQKVDDAFQQAVEEGTSYELELRIIRPDGEERTIISRSQVQRNADGEISEIIGTNQDITELRQTEQALKRSEEKYRSLFENMLDGFAYHKIITDDKGQAVDYIFLEVNRAFEKLTGLTRDKILGKKVTEVIPDIKDDQTDWIKIYGDVALTGKPLSSEDYSKALDTWFSIHAYCPTRGYFATVFEDITERKKANEQLRNIFKNSTIMFYSHTPEHLVTFISPQVEDILGYTQEEAKVQWTEMASDNPINESGFKLTEKAIKTGKPQGVYELELIRKDGEKVIIEVNESPVVENGKTVAIVGSLTDITERKQAEREVAEAKSLLEATLSTLTESVIVIDPADRSIVIANPATERMFGYEQSELIGGNTAFLHVDQEMYEKFGEIGNPALEKNGVFKTEYKMKKKDGTIFDTENIVTIISEQAGWRDGVVSVIRDITERKNAAQNLQKSEEKYRMIVENAHDGIEITQNDRFIYVNTRFAEMLGYTVEELMNTPTSEIFTEKAMVSLQKRRDVRQSGLKLANECETTFLRKDGTVIDVHVRFEITNFQGKSATFATINDISRQKQAEKEQANLEAQLHQSQKLEAVGTMVGGIAHEFNNILQGLFLYSGIVYDQLPADKELQSDFQRIVDSSERAKHLVNQILVFSRKHSGEQQPAHIQYLLKEVLKQMRETAPPGIAIKESIDTSCAPVLCDTAQINQVFVNLFNNAVQAMEDEGGIISVSLKEVDTQIEIFPGEKSSPASGVIELTVSDTGHGMDAETLEQIFDPFYTTKSVGKGTGLGLSIVHEIISDMHGQIKVESEVGQGTTFTILLPTTSMEEETEVVPEVDTDQVSRPLRILFVDDEEGISRATKSLLEKQGCTITIAENGEEGLALFKQDRASYDLVITDLSMPEMSGVELGQAIRKLSMHVQLILSTGDLDDNLQQECLSLGFNGFIRKPWSETELVKAINAIGPHDTAS